LEDLFGAESDEEEEFKSDIQITTSHGSINKNNVIDESNVDALFNDDGSLHSDEEAEAGNLAETQAYFTTEKKGAQRLTGEETQSTGATFITSEPIPHIPENAKVIRKINKNS